MFENVSIVTVALIACSCYVVYWYMFKSRRYSPPLPPSPRFSLPWIGHLYLFKLDMRKCFREFKKKYGDIFSMQFGNRPMVVLSSYRVIKEAFRTNGDRFPLRPELPLLDRVSRKLGIVNTNGPGWKEHRRFALSTLRDFGMGKSKLDKKIHSEAALLVEEFADHKGEPFDPKGIIASHVANIVCSMSFGMNFKHSDARFIDMTRRFDENLRSVAGLANFIPQLEYLPGDPLKVKKMMDNSRTVFAYCFEIIQEHIDTYDEDNIDDLTHAYIKEMRRAEAAKEDTTMNYEFLAAVLADLFIAGSETTTTALRWSLVLLTEYPDIQERLFQDIKEKIGTDRFPSLHDKTSLKYMEAFYMEVLRFCNLTSAGIFHTASEDIVLCGYTVPAGAIVLPDFDCLFMDPDIWGDPAVFRPDRFIDKEGNLVKKDEFLPFFIGKRSCVGESLARTEMLLFLTSLIQSFKF